MLWLYPILQVLLAQARASLDVFVACGIRSLHLILLPCIRMTDL